MVSERTVSASSMAAECSACPIREGTSGGLCGWVLTWPWPVFVSRNLPSWRWGFKTMLKVTHTKTLRVNQGRKKIAVKMLKYEPELVSIWYSCCSNHPCARAGVVPGMSCGRQWAKSAHGGTCCLSPVMFSVWAHTRSIHGGVISRSGKSWDSNNSQGVTPWLISVVRSFRLAVAQVKCTQGWRTLVLCFGASLFSYLVTAFSEGQGNRYPSLDHLKRAVGRVLQFHPKENSAASTAQLGEPCL